MSDRFEDQMEENNSLMQRIAPGALSRRRLLIGGGVATLAVVAAACGDDDDEPASSGATSSTADDSSSTTAGDASGDLAVAMTAASLEVLAVGTYDAALKAATSGALGEVPPVVATFVTTAMAHHQAHLDAWNEVITGAGEEEVTEPPAELKETVDGEFAKVTDAAGAAALALTLEQTAADTYFAVIPTLEGEDAVKLAASIQPIDMQHVAILNFALGEYPVPDTFATTENAFTG
ncbi:MAG: ferritin-like domain-containing protein [Actinomycetota bacterium]|nr:ferritin-like domain-containing protein [Acidimicrobiia bacterium]MDQ3146058.1 ferritin-like domain-containing protein [Actinomycetota bacterium]